MYLWLLTYLLRIYAIIKTILNPHIQPFMFKYFITFLLLLDFVNPSQTKITVRFESLDFSDVQYDDYAPMPYKDGILFVSSSRTKSNYTGLFFTDFKSSPKMIEVKGEKNTSVKLFTMRQTISFMLPNPRKRILNLRLIWLYIRVKSTISR